MSEPATWNQPAGWNGPEHTRHVLSQVAIVAARNPSEYASPFDSWVRCSIEFGLMPDGRCDIPRVGDREIQLEHERLGEKLALAQVEMDYLDRIVRSSGYAVTLSNAESMILAGRNYHHPMAPACDARPGTIWDERFGGTNAVAMSIRDGRPTSLRRNEHFFVDHLDESCLNIPLFAPDTSLWGSLGISNKNPDLESATHVFALKVLAASAERLSQEVFRREFKDNWVLKFKPSGRAQSCLLAINEDGYVIGADRAARRSLSITAEKLGGFSLWDRFSGDRSRLARFAGDEGRDLELTYIETGATIEAVVIGALQRPVRSSVATPIQARIMPTHEGITMDEWSGNDPAMRQDVAALRRIVARRLPIILLGETGVGKDTLARAFHAESPRHSKPFIAMNCGAIPESLIESELFGYAGGAFTGARKGGTPGRFRQAHEGTLFLDEIGEMPLPLQTRLLRVLESGEVYPLGSTDVHAVDIQVIAATNCDLEASVAAGTFRKDLYYRLAGMVIHIPALRERQDVADLIERLAAKIAGTQGLSLSPAARAALLAHSWPGNLRELSLVLERAACLASSNVIEPEDLRLTSIPAIGNGRESGPLGAFDDDPHYIAIKAALVRSGGDTVAMTRSLGMSRATLYRRLKKYGITRTS